MNIVNILEKAKKLFADNEGIICGKRRFTYLEFIERVEGLARAFLNYGLKSGDRIAILHHNCHIYLETYYAAAYAGLILVPVNYRLSSKELGFIFKDSECKLIISNSNIKNNIDEALSVESNSKNIGTIIWCCVLDQGNSKIINNDRITQINYEVAITKSNLEIPNIKKNDDSPAHLYYTSGTTGNPKGVILTHGNVVTHAKAAVEEFQLIEQDVWGHIAPLYHLADAWATFAITLVGAKHVLLPKFEPFKVLASIRGEGITLSNLIPTMLNQLVNEPTVNQYSYPSLRYIMSGGAPIAPELVRKSINTFGCEYVQTYGMTETSPILTMSLLKDHLKNLPKDKQFWYQCRTGRVFKTVELRVVGIDRSDVKTDNTEVGEIWVRGPTITPGYWNDPEETEAAFEDGWLKTGDLAVIEPEGYINIVDRKRDMILTGGENVYSTEVEHVLYEHPAILEAAVIGVPDEKWGEAVKSVVVLKGGVTVTESELIQFCKSRLTHYKAPKSIDFASELPKTGTGKISKKVLKEKFWVGFEKRVH